MSEAQPPSPSNKKRKIVKVKQACGNCRERKTRCDGRQPICGPCAKRCVHGTCSYEIGTDLAKQPLAGESNATYGGIEYNSFLPRYSIPEGQPRPGAIGSATGRTLSGQSDSKRQVVDALATVDPEDQVDDGVHYGDSSTIAFVREVKLSSQLGPRTPPTADIDTTLSSWPSGELEPLDLTLGRDAGSFSLPIRTHADDYVHCFFEFVQPLFPLIHRNTFVAKYERLWKAPRSHQPDEDVLFMPMLNLVFALGCKFSAFVSLDQKTSTANGFYEKSRSVLLYDILGSTSPAVVQWLLLSGVYFQSTSHASHCWNSIGLAIRLAQSLGLHLEHTGRKLESQLVREMKRRIWHTCVVLDRLLSMTFGRPFMVNKPGTTPVPSLIDDEYLSTTNSDGKQPSGVPSRLGLCVYSSKLFEILADILSSFYSAESQPTLNAASNLQSIVRQALEFNSRLDRFVESVPSYLQPSKTHDLPALHRNNVLNLQQQVLHCRFLYTRLLSLRPVLLLATRQERKVGAAATAVASTASLDDHLVKSCCELCATSAHALVEAIHAHLDTAYKSTGWHSVYFTFASATILLASIKVPDGPAGPTTTFEVSWQRIMTILKHYERQIHSAPYALKVLETLRRQITEPTIADPLPVQHFPSASVQAQMADTALVMPQDPLNSLLQFDFSQFNPYGVDSLSDAWYGQHVANIGGMQGVMGCTNGF